MALLNSAPRLKSGLFTRGYSHTFFANNFSTTLPKEVLIEATSAYLRRAATFAPYFVHGCNCSAKGYEDLTVQTANISS